MKAVMDKVTKDKGATLVGSEGACEDQKSVCTKK
jgi:hypothetical protein